MEIIRTRVYERQAEKLLSEAETVAAENEIAGDPERWPVIPGTGGCRKARAARGGSGKSGGVRIIYFYRTTKGTIYLLTVYAKNQQDNLSADQKREMKALIKALEH